MEGNGTLPPDTKCRVGEMPGGDIYTANMSVTEGVSWCSKPFFFEFSLCLSRACLGKLMHFIYKWRKKCFLPSRHLILSGGVFHWLLRLESLLSPGLEACRLGMD